LKSAIDIVTFGKQTNNVTVMSAISSCSECK